jgi:hypothetical protein
MFLISAVLMHSYEYLFLKVAMAVPILGEYLDFTVHVKGFYFILRAGEGTNRF